MAAAVVLSLHPASAPLSHTQGKLPLFKIFLAQDFIHRKHLHNIISAASKSTYQPLIATCAVVFLIF